MFTRIVRWGRGLIELFPLPFVLLFVVVFGAAVWRSEVRVARLAADYGKTMISEKAVDRLAVPSKEM